MNQRKWLVEDAATGTCQWLFNHKKYKTWLAQPHTLLWIVGKPGAGKSTLMRYALRGTSQSTEVIASFFFFGRGSDLQKSPSGLFRSLLHQLLDQMPEMLSDFILIYQKRRGTKWISGSDCEWHEIELREFLEQWILSASRARSIRIYVDALDEAGQDVAVKLVAYFDGLIERLLPTRASFKICFSCRHYPVLAPKTALRICVEEENHEDIATYVRQNLTEHQLSDQDEAQKLTQDVIGKAANIFQWVVLIIPIIIESDKDGASAKKLRQDINEMPGELGHLYGQILSRIKHPKRALQLMQWVCFAQRPLSLDELRYAMVMDITNNFTSLEECESSVDFAQNKEHMEKMVNSLSGGLAETVEYNGRQTVRFIHQSVNDYLLGGGLLKLDDSFFHDINHYLNQSKLQSLDSSLSDNVVALAHFRLSRSCVKYILSKEIMEQVDPLNRHPFVDYSRQERRSTDRFPFLLYSADWTSHAETVEKQRIRQADLLHLFRWPSVRDWACFFYTSNDVGKVTQRESLLFIASRHSLLSIIEAIINSGVSTNLNSRDYNGNTPLSLAAMQGHEAIVQLLTERSDIDINSKNETGQTPLSFAARQGHEAVVRLLIERKDIDINSKDISGQTPLSCAGQEGHEAIVRQLIEREDVDVNLTDNQGRTPLSLAARQGHVAIVRLLIERSDVDINSKDGVGWTLLSLAALNGYEGMVRLLMERRDIEIERKGGFGKTPLELAKGLRHKSVVKILKEEIARRQRRLKV